MDNTDDKKPSRSPRGPKPLPAELHPDMALDPHQASAIVGLAPITLAQLRGRGEGPRFSRYGRSIRYRVGDLLAWRDEHAVGRKVAP
jgi:hypothetical protein